MEGGVRIGRSKGRFSPHSAGLIALVMVALLLTLAISGQAQATTTTYPGPVAVPYSSGYSSNWGDTGATGMVLLNNVNTWGNAAGPPNTTRFTTSRSYKITSITNWHKLTTYPGGTISLLDSSGATLGTWVGDWMTNPFWKYVRPNITIGPGTYTIVDSASSSWAWNTTSLYMGFTRVLAIPVNEAPVITSDGGGDTAVVYVAPGSTIVTDVDATDPDPGDVLTYRILGGRLNPALWVVNIDPVTGVLEFVSGRLGWGLRYPLFLCNVTVEVRDNGTPSLADTQVISIYLAPGT